MRLMSTVKLKEGTILAQPIYNENGRVLIQRGMRLTKTMIRRLIKQGIAYVYIEDSIIGKVQVDSSISTQLRVEATQTIKDTFYELKDSGFTEKSYILEKKGNKLTTAVQDIIGEINKQDEAISLLTDILISDDYTFQHSLNVTIYSLAIGTKLNLSDAELSDLGTGAMLHDIGKVFIDKDILLKTGKLTDKEFEVMKSHTQLGFDFIRKWTDLSTVIAHCAYQHHERLDGSGYPRGLVDNQIHKYAKIIGIADVFDAVTSNRIYRSAMLPHIGLEILYAGAVNIFDKSMVEAFKNSIVVYPNGLTVQLNDGRVGTVTKQNKNICDRPFIEITSENDQQLSSSYEVDLSKKMNLMITACHVG